MSEPPNFSDKQIEHFKECFQMFDKTSVGTVSVKELGSLLRAVGQNPSIEHIQFIQESVEQKKDTLEFDEFVGLLEQFWVDSGENELREAFLVFDREGNSYVTQEDFKKVMSTLGERLTEDELKELIKDCNVNTDGTINYEDFIKTVTASMQ